MESWQANKTVMASNVTLAINESLELSSITVLSPPSVVGGEVYFLKVVLTCLYNIGFSGYEKVFKKQRF